MVQLYHPDIPHTKDQPVIRSRKAYDDRLKKKGWRMWPPKTPKKENE
jgi:hypothetical protein